MIDAQTREDRRTYLGASDIAAVVGLDPWGRTGGDIVLAKRGRLPDRDLGPAVEVGTYAETGILDWTSDRLRVPITRDVSLLHPDGVLGANLDGLALMHDPPAVVEAKAVGIVGRPRYLDEFGDAGSDAVPAHVLVQVMHQLVVANAQPDLPAIPLAIVAALIGGRGLVLYRIPYDAELGAMLEARGRAFWRDYVVTGTMPPDEPPALENLVAMTREPGRRVDLDADLLATWRAAVEAKRAAEQVEREAKRAVLAAMGDAEAGGCEGVGEVTVRTVHRKEMVVPASEFKRVDFRAAKPQRAAS